MTIQSGTHAIESMQLEERRYPPPPEFAKNANAKADIYNKPLEDFWREEAQKRVTWFKPFDKVLEWKLPYAKWFLGGKLNVCYNCVDRHVEAGRGDKVAYFWEGEPVDQKRTLTFKDLQTEVVRFANALKKLGVKKGTPVGIYMGMVPELPVAMLACTRLGAPHTVVFGGFSADALAGRLNDMECELLITQNEGLRKGNPVPLKKNADAALESAPKVKKAVVLRRTPSDTPMKDGRDIWWQDLVKDASTDPKTSPCEEMDAEDLLYLLYTSGTTAKPKGIVHTTAGYLVGTATTHHYIFDIKPDSIYWCAADIGWVTGHSYIVYAPLCNGTTGTGMILITPLPGVTTLKPGSATKPFPTVEAAVYNDAGEEVGPGGGGYLVLKRPWPAMLRGIFKDHDRYVQTYWSKFKDVYFAGDGARIDEDGDFWLLGRVDDVMNISAHRISTIEVESALVAHPKVAEAAVCGRSDKQTGQAIVAFVTLRGGAEGSPEMLRELRNFVGEKIGKIAAPANIVFTPDLPKTRSGKIMRRLLRDVAENRPLGDTTTLADPAVVSEIDRRAKTEAAKEEASA